jgi:hypothetical protein
VWLASRALLEISRCPAASSAEHVKDQSPSNHAKRNAVRLSGEYNLLPVQETGNPRQAHRVSSLGLAYFSRS